MTPAGQPPAPPPDLIDSWRARGRRSAISLHVTLLAVAAMVLAAAVILHVDAQGHVATPWNSSGSSLPPLCFFRRTLGIDCPGCGLTRCFVSAAHGNLAQAWSFHPAGVFMFGLLLAQFPYRTIQIVRLLRGQEELPVMQWAPWLAGTIGVLLIGQWAVRMIL